MPALYSYECLICKHDFEKLISIRDFEKSHYRTCPKCGKPAKRIMSSKGALRDEPTWLPSACEVAVPDGERSPQTRSEWNAFKKKNHFEEKCDYGPVLVSI